METSIFISKILSVVYIIVGLGMLLRTEFYKKMIEDINKNPSFMYLGGVMALAIGLVITNLYNRWEANWTILITLIGWIAIIKGVVILLFPKQMIKFSEKMLEKSLKAWGVFAVGTGLVFAYFGYLS